MTPKEAIRILEQLKEHQYESDIDAFDMAINALKKQMPMRVINMHIDEYYCPNCGSENPKRIGKNRNIVLSGLWSENSEV